MTDEASSSTIITPSIAKIAAALAAAQGEFQPIAKTRTVTVRSDKGNYTFDYAPLDEVLACTRPSLSKHGIALVQIIRGGGTGETHLITTLMHASGESISSEVVLPYKPQKAQELGSLLTYLRRYTIISILGVVAEEDDDGNAADGNWSERSERRPPDRGSAPPPSEPRQPPRSAPRAAAKPARPLLERILFASTNEELQALSAEVALLPHGEEREQATAAGLRRRAELDECASMDQRSSDKPLPTEHERLAAELLGRCQQAATMSEIAAITKAATPLPRDSESRRAVLRAIDDATERLRPKRAAR